MRGMSRRVYLQKNMDTTIKNWGRGGGKSAYRLQTNTTDLGRFLESIVFKSESRPCENPPDCVP